MGRCVAVKAAVSFYFTEQKYVLCMLVYLANHSVIAFIQWFTKEDTELQGQ